MSFCPQPEQTPFWATGGLSTLGDIDDGLRLDLGHEFATDPDMMPWGDRPDMINPFSGWSGFRNQFLAARPRDLNEFRAALGRMNADPEGTVDPDQLRDDLATIIRRRSIPRPPVRRDREPSIAPRRYGNSVQDLLLTAMGWHFAQMLKDGRFETTGQAADWLERNLTPENRAGLEAAGCRQMSRNPRDAPKTRFRRRRRGSWPVRPSRRGSRGP